MPAPHKIIGKKNETLVAVSVIIESALFSALPAEIANYRMNIDDRHETFRNKVLSVKRRSFYFSKKTDQCHLMS